MALEPGIYVTSSVKLLHQLRKGSMGEVWLADHEALRTNVVVKVIDEALLDCRPDASGRFKREASATAQIKSPHVVQIFDYGEMEDGTQYMVMEKLEGESLGERLKADKWLSPEDTVELLRQAGNALDLSHSNDIIHRDIKPHNIFLRQVHGELHVKVLDFGLAKSMDPDDSGQQLTTPGMVVGTVQYFSRELVLGVAEIDYRVDLWALAVVTYRCLTGELPFGGREITEICDAITSAKFRRPSKLRKELPSTVDDWCSRAFHPDPSARYTSAAQMARALREALAGEAMAVFPEGSKSASSLPLPRWALLAGSGVAIAAVLAVVLALTLGGDTPGTGAGTASPGGDRSAAPTAVGSSLTATSAGSTSAGSTSAGSTSAAVSSASAKASSVPPGSVDGMILIAGGEFWRGCDDKNAQSCSANEKPGRQVFIDPFHVDRTEVTVEAYKRCVDGGKCSAERLDGYAVLQGGQFTRSEQCNWGQEGRAEHPINCVAHEQAATFCRAVGKRLLSEAEWEKAARGTDRRSYPWGEDRPTCDNTVMASSLPGCGKGQTWPVGQQAADVSPFGVLDMSGNVAEWVADWYGPTYYRDAPARNPAGPAEGPLKVARGGCYRDLTPPLLRTAMRAAYSPSARSPRIGFRCGRSQE